jgi:hypothetical protein
MGTDRMSIPPIWEAPPRTDICNIRLLTCNSTRNLVSCFCARRKARTTLPVNGSPKN